MQTTALTQPATEATAPAVVPRLDNLETTFSTRFALLDSEGNEKQKVLAARLILTTKMPERERRALRIMNCGTTVSVRDGADGPYICSSRCRDRLCPSCQQAKRRKLTATITERMAEYKRPKFITLTIKRDASALSSQITKVISSFRKLRTRAVWKNSVKRGIYAVEWDADPISGQWRAHIHCLIDSVFIDKEWLHRVWLEITGDSFIVDIRKANAKTPGYLAKYMSKSIKSETLQEELWHIAMELKGRRLAGKFGKEKPLNEDADPNEDPIIGTLHEVIEKAKAGDPNMIRVLQQLCARYHIEQPPEIRYPVDDT